MGQMVMPRGANGQHMIDIEKGQPKGSRGHEAPQVLHNENAIYQLDSEQGIHKIERRQKQVKSKTRSKSSS